MLSFIETLGWAAMATTVLSFLPKDEIRIRSINSVACVFWITYGLLVKQPPVYAVNFIVLLIHLKHLTKK